jgi:hypothetical protein
MTKPSNIITQFQVDKHFEAIKQIGTANSAGLFGGLIALYYFKDWKTPVLPGIKYATSIYLGGVLLFTLAYCLFIAFIYTHKPTMRPTKNMPPSVFQDGPFFKSILLMTAVSLGLWIAGTIAAFHVLSML